MKITILCVGKIKESFYRDALKEYSKRLSRYVNLEIIEVADEKAPEGLSETEALKIKDKEGEKILGKLKDSFIIPLVIDGKSLDSREFSDFIKEKALRGTSHITFIIGGSLGLSEEVIKKGDFLLSFSKMTFPHQLMRVILLEQVYRAYRIINNEPYHK
ncbi:MAG: 23S rRNA (pseudouridine(1915)-N(3))-methyltransferase RlmH [Clostridiales bacterium]|nr:23S rRNA (pseudouridine(1915)-N(3))-methyltransferase RlmH [Clostridiales bacterium]MCD8159229.1 23S rRNA (pseudouridine(1915)-N(3))-methyltransferase RlmH [Clostridiales bacterium]